MKSLLLSPYSFVTKGDRLCFRSPAWMKQTVSSWWNCMHLLSEVQLQSWRNSSGVSEFKNKGSHLGKWNDSVYQRISGDHSRCTYSRMNVLNGGSLIHLSKTSSKDYVGCKNRCLVWSDNRCQNLKKIEQYVKNRTFTSSQERVTLCPFS